MKPRKASTTSGLTLIELVVAMALFALVAVMGMQSLTGTLRVSQRLGAIDTDNADLSHALALLRNDMTRIFPMLFYPPDSAPLAAVWQSENRQTIGLSVAGQPNLRPDASDRHYALWSIEGDENVLTRRYWSSLTPAIHSQLSDELIVLRGVRGLGLRTYWENTGWVEGPFAPVVAVAPGSAFVPLADGDEASSAPPAAYFSVVPVAIEITVQTERWGNLPLVQALR